MAHLSALWNTRTKYESHRFNITFVEFGIGTPNYTQPVNIGNPVEHTIEEFAFIIRDLVGSSSEIEYKPPVEDDPQRRKPDIERAMKYLNWEPRVTLTNGLKKAIEYFREDLKRSTNGSPNYDPYKETIIEPNEML